MIYPLFILGLLGPTVTPTIKAPVKVVAQASVDEPTPKLYLCAGPKGGTYHKVGLELEARLKGRVEVNVQITRGSWENLEAIDSIPRRCDAIIAQDDAFTLYRYERPESRLMMDRMASLFPEHIQLLCNRSVEASEISELKEETILINEYGSGPYITWKLFERLNPAYKKLKQKEMSMEEGVLKVLDGVQGQCTIMVSTSGLGTPAMIDKQFGDRLKIIGVADDKLTRPVGPDRRPIYHVASIKEGTYPKMKNEELETYSVQAIFFASPEWKARHPKAAHQVAVALLALIPEIRDAIK